MSPTITIQERAPAKGARPFLLISDGKHTEIADWQADLSREDNAWEALAAWVAGHPRLAGVYFCCEVKVDNRHSHYCFKRVEESDVRRIDRTGHLVSVTAWRQSGVSHDDSDQRDQVDKPRLTYVK